MSTTECSNRAYARHPPHPLPRLAAEVVHLDLALRLGLLRAQFGVPVGPHAPDVLEAVPEFGVGGAVAQKRAQVVAEKAQEK